MGLSDLAFLAAAKRPLVVGVLGPHSAGKTTLLAAWYLLIARGIAELQDRAFSGSYTLSGWEAIAGNLRWEPQMPPSFPQHTVSTGGRLPGLLHMEFAGLSRRQSFLFADAPGEWFNRWAINENDPAAVGAQWLADNADVFLLVADREALSGSARGQARSALQYLSKRLGACIGDRPVAVVWTKADTAITPEMELAVRKITQASLGNPQEFSVSIKSTEQEAVTALSTILSWITKQKGNDLKAPAEIASSNDPLFLVGRRCAA